MGNVITPAEVERRMVDLSESLDAATTEWEQADFDHRVAKNNFELQMARTRLELHSSGRKLTAQQREDEALLACEELYAILGYAETRQRACRARIDLLRSQADLLRSLGTSVRTAMDFT
jgi:hypothetical protein